MKYFRDKVIIVTGASSGIGEVAAIRLSELGAKVVLAARSEHKLAELQDRIESSGNEAISVKTDISVESDVTNLVDKTFEKWGRIDILISNAGQYVKGSLSNINISDFQNSFDVNFYGVKCGIMYHCISFAVEMHLCSKFLINTGMN